MTKGRFHIRRISIGLYLIGIHLLAGYFVVRELRAVFEPGNDQILNAVQDPTLHEPLHFPLPVPSILADLHSRDAESTDLELIVPVAGVASEQLIDSFNDTRATSNHDAIDIPAPEGTPVIAAAEGVIARFFDSEAGGTTIYQLTSGGKYVLYYAHLQRRADGLKPGDKVIRGQVIGYVGNTGNAGPDNFHLHFSIARVRDPARYWEGEYINPFDHLRKNQP